MVFSHLHSKVTDAPNRQSCLYPNLTLCNCPHSCLLFHISGHAAYGSTSPSNFLPAHSYYIFITFSPPKTHHVIISMFICNFRKKELAQRTKKAARTRLSQQLPKSVFKNSFKYPIKENRNRKLLPCVFNQDFPVIPVRNLFYNIQPKSMPFLFPLRCQIVIFLQDTGFFIRV